MWWVVFVVLTHLDRGLPWDSVGPEGAHGIFPCATVSAVGGRVLYRVTDGVELVRSAVSRTGTLKSCSVSASPAEVRAFARECVMASGGHADGTQLPDARFARAAEAKEACVRHQAARDALRPRHAQRAPRRSRRGFTYPGTLWCGAGNMADHYDQLGEFADTDRCCRTHDHCPHVIHAFSSNYGHTNFKWHSICHCDCDYALKSCLRKVNDSSSRVVGQAFFNVIGVPCFRLDYQEQCAERHWYGMCKRYEQFPVAVLEEAVPYDFGGIDVIDELVVVPRKNKSAEEGKRDSSTQTTTASTEEPSLTNVVTAAEDFIKVLATVSTSQSSNAESEANQGSKSEKKKKKTSKGKKSKKPKTRGKGRKRKQKARGGTAPEEGAAVSHPGGKAEEVRAHSNFISESQGREPLRRNGTGDLTLTRKGEPSNEVMKDKPASDGMSVHVSSLENMERIPEVLHCEEEMSPRTNPTVIKPQTHRTSQPCKQRPGNKSHPGPTHEQPNGQRRRAGEQSLVKTAASISTYTAVSPKNKFKEQRAKEGRKTWRKTLLPSTSLSVHPQIQEVSPPNVPSLPLIEQQTSQTPHQDRLRSQVTTPKPSCRVLKTQRLREKALRSRRRKDPTPPLAQGTHHAPNTSDQVSALFLTPEMFQTTTSTVTRASRADWRTSTTTALTVGTALTQQTVRQRRRPRKPAAAAALSREAPQFKAEPETITTSASVLSEATTSQKDSTPTSAAPVITPLQLSMEKLRAQLRRKKRRKAAMLSGTVRRSDLVVRDRRSSSSADA